MDHPPILGEVLTPFELEMNCNSFFFKLIVFTLLLHVSNVRMRDVKGLKGRSLRILHASPELATCQSISK
jgi:hypothetical protein